MMMLTHWILNLKFGPQMSIVKKYIWLKIIWQCVSVCVEFIGVVWITGTLVSAHAHEAKNQYDGTFCQSPKWYEKHCVIGMRRNSNVQF